MVIDWQINELCTQINRISKMCSFYRRHVILKTWYYKLYKKMLYTFFPTFKGRFLNVPVTFVIQFSSSFG